ncbi:hypothetical protein SUNI508_09587 [Seiridium unicorne]|uniref:Uncharacterized protein n=1 Tax=Seiridium unicorne TaxID=138068 RepID=A0ABR2UPX3_9PEZI
MPGSHHSKSSHSWEQRTHVSHPSQAGSHGSHHTYAGSHTSHRSQAGSRTSHHSQAGSRASYHSQRGDPEQSGSVALSRARSDGGRRSQYQPPGRPVIYGGREWHISADGSFDAMHDLETQLRHNAEMAAGVPSLAPDDSISNAGPLLQRRASSTYHGSSHSAAEHGRSYGPSGTGSKLRQSSRSHGRSQSHGSSQSRGSSHFHGSNTQSSHSRESSRSSFVEEGGTEVVRLKDGRLALSRKKRNRFLWF